MKTKLFTFILIITNILIGFSQEENQVLENYIQKNYTTKEVSRLPISNEELQKKIKFYVDDKNNIYLNGEQIYNLVVTQFDYDNLKNSTLKFHTFSFKAGKRVYKKNRFSEPIFSNDGKHALFYETIICKGLCGGGSLILMEKINNSWIQKAVLFAWIG